MTKKKIYICPDCKSELAFDSADELECPDCKKVLNKDSCSEKMESGTRLDVQDLYWEDMTSKFERTPEGYLRGRACVTNIGVFSYLVDGKVVNELRLREDVMDWESLETLLLKPLTNGHPKVAVDSSNIKQFAVGTLGSAVSRDQDRVYIDILITDPKAIEDIEMGRRALSCGYTRQQEMKSGVHNGVRYDCIQRNIRYNHVALVDKGRAGDDAVLRLDGFTFDGINDSSKPIQENKNMFKLNLDGVGEVEVPESVHIAFMKQRVSLDEANAQVAVLKSEKSQIEATRDAAKEALDAKDAVIAELKTALDEAPKVIEAKLAARSALISQVKGYGVELKGDEDDLAIKKALVLHVSPKAVLDGKDEVYVSARFDAAIDSLVADKAIDDQNSSNTSDKPSEDSADKPLTADAAFEAYAKSLQDASK